MGSFGAKTLKYTVLLGLMPRAEFEPRLWGTLPGLGSLQRPLNFKDLREALARTMGCNSMPSFTKPPTFQTSFGSEA